MTKYPESPREAARAFTPELTGVINNAVLGCVDRSPMVCLT